MPESATIDSPTSERHRPSSQSIRLAHNDDSVAHIDLNQLFGRQQAETSRLIEAIDRERARLGYQLHDSVAQSLAALRFQLVALEGRIEHDPGLVEHLRSLRDSVADVLEEVRMLSLSVHPRIVDDLGLPLALRHLTRTRDSGLDVTFRCDPENERKIRELPVAAARGLYLVVQECLDNAERHAEASRLTIELDVVEDTVRVQIADDGRGFDTNVLCEPAVSTGLLLITQRLAIGGGSLRLNSTQATGTTISAQVPLTTPIP